MREIEFWKFFFLERGKVRQTASQSGLGDSQFEQKLHQQSDYLKLVTPL